MGKADEERLLRDRKLVLLVDLDQTLIHTTNDEIPANIEVIISKSFFTEMLTVYLFDGFEIVSGCLSLPTSWAQLSLVSHSPKTIYQAAPS